MDDSQKYPNIIQYLQTLKSNSHPDLDVEVELKRIIDHWLKDTIEWIEHRFTTNSTGVCQKMIEYSVNKEPFIEDGDNLCKNSILKIIRSSGEVEDVLYRYYFADNINFVFLKDVTTTDEYSIDRFTYQKNKDFFFKVLPEYENNLAKDRPVLAELLSST